jgi:hypothetical protein
MQKIRNETEAINGNNIELWKFKVVENYHRTNILMRVEDILRIELKFAVNI